jgi:acetolactate synthase-1/2/3 large subunit
MKNPIIEIKVKNFGTMTAELYPEKAPKTVANFVKLAEAMGAVGIRATTQEEFKAAFKEALTLGRPVVIDCQIDSDDKVWPMVAPGAAISEAFSEEDLKDK